MHVTPSEREVALNIPACIIPAPVVRLPGLRRQRDLAALTQEQLAEIADLRRQTIARLEHGGEATHTTVRKLAAALACAPADLYRA